MSDQSEPKTGWFKRLVSGLTKTSSRLVSGITDIVTKRKLDDTMLAELTDLLITADLGTKTADKLTGDLAKTRFGKDVSADGFVASRVFNPQRGSSASGSKCASDSG